MNRYFVSKCDEEDGRRTWDVCDRQSEGTAVANHDTRQKARDDAGARESVILVEKSRSVRKALEFGNHYGTKLVLLALLLCSSVAYAKPPARLYGDPRACVAVGFVGGNPYVSTVTPEQRVTAYGVEVQDARDAVDAYLDRTPMAEVSIPTVRSMVAGIEATLWRWRCYDISGSEVARRIYLRWAAAVERELKAEELRRSCVRYCEHEAWPRCEPEQCVVAEANP